MMKVSVIMPSYLGQYENCAKDRDRKFLRAVKSFIDQNYPERELIIVSDGCEITNALYKHNFESFRNIKLVPMEKQPLFSGEVRQRGILSATGDIICFLDSDDLIMPHHLRVIASTISTIGMDQWIMFSDNYKHPADGKIYPRQFKPEFGYMGTSNIAYKRNLPVSWSGCDGYGHDWKFIQQLMKIGEGKRIYGAGYVVCHIPQQLDV